MNTKIYIFITAIIAATLFFLLLTTRLPGGDQVSTLIGPRSWPLFILTGLLFLTIALLIVTLKSSNKLGSSAFEDVGSGPEMNENESIGTASSSIEDSRFVVRYRHWLLLLMTVLYTFLMDVAGFLIATILFTFVCTIILGARKKLNIALATIAGALLVSVVFNYLLNIPLP